MPSGSPLKREVSFLLIQADAASRRGLIQALARMVISIDTHQRECTCHGSNPDCFKCGGWGYIDSVSENRLIDGPAGDAGFNSRPAHRTTTKKAPRKSKSAITSPQKRIANKAKPSADESVLCKCGSRIAKSYYGHHLVLDCKKNRKKVQRTLKKASQKKKNRKIFRIITSNADYAAKFENNAQIRKLDATNLYAHNFRERGAFGSHPSHDRFDDESSA